MKVNAITEGLTDYALDREESEAREQLIRWATAVFDPCCCECGWLTSAKQELRAAQQRARAIGVFDGQPGEADWLAGHRVERPMELDEMYLSVEIGSI